MGNAVCQPDAEKEARLLAGVDEACGEVAHLISQAEVLLLTTGAGFSADSGLAVYADVAKIGAYAKRGVTYHDLCQPHWLEEEPELFWGFWGQCYNDYRETAPHAGYEIIERWVEQRFRSSAVGQAIRQGLAPRWVEQCDEEEEAYQQPYVVGDGDHAGGFFVFTSNVDAHHFDWFRACEIRECHGNTEQYQCTARACPSHVWRAPQDFRFVVDKETMLAPAASSVPTPAQAAVSEPRDKSSAGGSAGVPRIGHVTGTARTIALRHMPGTAPPAESPGFQGNHPTCPACGQPARPAILMFEDCSWKDLDLQRRRFNKWQAVVKEQAAMRGKGSALRVVILEIGAGGNVTTVRTQSESALRIFAGSGADVKLVRVNPDFPLGDRECYTPGGDQASMVISIMARGLESLHKMDAALQQLDLGLG